MNASDFVPLRGGLTLPIAALRLVWDLEDRGFSMRQDGDALRISPGDRLTDGDRLLIRRWKAHLLAVTAQVEGFNAQAEAR